MKDQEGGEGATDARSMSPHAGAGSTTVPAGRGGGEGGGVQGGRGFKGGRGGFRGEEEGDLTF